MLHLIGVAHRAQAQTRGEGITEAQAKFAKSLCGIVEQFSPILIAEEDSEEALDGRNGASIAREIAVEYGIEHRFCDPNEAQRAEIGYRDCVSLQQEMSLRHTDLSEDQICIRAKAIEIARYFPKRELFWLEQLADRLSGQVIFVCGDFHLETFCDLLEGKGVPYEILHRGIGLTESDRQFDRKVRHYLRDRPELSK